MYQAMCIGHAEAGTTAHQKWLDSTPAHIEPAEFLPNGLLSVP